MKRDAQALRSALAELNAQHLLRRRRTIEDYREQGNRTEITVDGHRVVDFCGNDYLGLAHHPEMSVVLAQAAARIGTGSGAAHLVTGHGIEHERLEEALAQFTGRERALLFSTGYMANLAVIGAFAGRGERVALDRLSHASLIDGARLCGAELKRYPHNDPSGIGTAAVIGTDGVFSMDGDLAPLPGLVEKSRQREAWLVVDDAHGLGVLGPTGRGTLEHFGLDAHDVPLLVGTLGKAFGSFGAFVAGDAEVIEFLMQKSRSYIYTTALPQPVAAATRRALEIVEREGWRRERVISLTRRFRRGAQELGLPLGDSSTPIQPILLGAAAEALRMQDTLFAQGFWVAAIRPPTVPPATARLRVTLSAAHTETQVDALLDALRGAVRAAA